MCGVLTTVNVGVAVAVTRSRIVLTSQALSTIGLPEHPEHLFILNIYLRLRQKITLSSKYTDGALLF